MLTFMSSLSSSSLSFKPLNISEEMVPQNIDETVTATYIWSDLIAISSLAMLSSGQLLLPRLQDSSSFPFK